MGLSTGIYASRISLGVVGIVPGCGGCPHYTVCLSVPDGKNENYL